MTAKAKAKTTAKISQAKPAVPPRVIAEVHLIDLARIKVEDQVRTEFSEESIAELAADIEARGLRAPIEVTPIGDEQYLLTLGERRLRALQLLGHKAAPALIVKTDDSNRLTDQLAENIQREELSLVDEAKAIRDLYNETQSVEAVARIVKKSKGWVSKRLAITYEDFSWRARNLLIEGYCEDVEILNVVSQLEQIDFNSAAKAYDAVRSGNMNRQQARDFLKATKAAAATKQPQETPEQAEAREKAAKAAMEANLAEQKLRLEGSGPEFIEWATERLSGLLVDAGDDYSAQEYLSGLSEDQRQALEAHLIGYGEKAAKTAFAALVKHFDFYDPQATYIEQMAILARLQNVEIKGALYALVDTLVRARNRVELTTESRQT